MHDVAECVSDVVRRPEHVAGSADLAHLVTLSISLSPPSLSAGSELCAIMHLQADCLFLFPRGT